MNISPRMRYWGGLTGIILLPLIIFFIFFITSGQNGEYQDRELLAHERTLNLANSLSSILQNKISVLERIGFIYNELSSTNTLASSQLVWRVAGLEDDITDIAVVDNRGKEVIRKSIETKTKLALGDRSQNIEFLAVREKGYYIGPMYLSQGKPLFLMGHAISSGDGKGISGAVFALFRADVLLDALKRATEQEGMLAFIVNEKGIVVAHQTFSYVSERKDISYNPAVKSALAGVAVPALVYNNELKENVVGSAVPLMISSDAHAYSTTGWFVIMETPAAIMFATAAHQRSLIVFGLLALAMYAGAGLWIVLYRMRASLGGLNHALKELAAGNLDYRLETSAGHTGKDLSIGVNNLAEKLAAISHDLAQERRGAEAERKKLTLALSEISDAVIACDQKGIIILANKRAEELTGYDMTGAAGKHIDEVVRLFENDKPISVGEYYSEVQEDGLRQMGSVTGLRLITAQNNERLVSARIGALGVKESMDHGGYMLAIHDMSHERFLEKVKADFVAITAHELRTPLTEMKWAMNILMGKELGFLSRRQKNIIKRSSESNEHMIRLVDDLLETAVIESAQFRYAKAPCDIKKIVSDMVDVRKKAAERKGVTLAFKKSKTRMPAIIADEAAIKIVINNLFDNAINYTPKGGKVNISMAKTDLALEIHVADTGIGIPQEDADHVFLKFFRGKAALKIVTDGTGLGLYIAKKIVEAHGGTIWVQSQQGQGSMFGVSIPV